MPRQILLARPHPFIVKEMKPFLEQHGYAVRRLEEEQSLESMVRSCVGAVISLAVTSSIGLEAEEVLKRVRCAAPNVPLVFGGMLPLESNKRRLEHLAQQTGFAGEALAVSTIAETRQALGTTSGWLYISKDDLLDPFRRELAARILQRHVR